MPGERCRGEESREPRGNPAPGQAGQEEDDEADADDEQRGAEIGLEGNERRRKRDEAQGGEETRRRGTASCASSPGCTRTTPKSIQRTAPRLRSPTTKTRARRTIVSA
jgi:hypothetical protein